MDSMMRRLGPRALKMYADWTDKIAAGVLPPAPERPTGVERNAVISMWDWGTQTSYMHDEITTSKQNPRVNAHGPVWAVDAAHGTWVMLDPLENTTKITPIQTRDDPKTMRSRFPRMPGFSTRASGAGRSPSRRTPNRATPPGRPIGWS